MAGGGEKDSELPGVWDQLEPGGGAGSGVSSRPHLSPRLCLSSPWAQSPEKHCSWQSSLLCLPASPTEPRSLPPSPSPPSSRYRQTPSPLPPAPDASLTPVWGQCRSGGAHPLLLVRDQQRSLRGYRRPAHSLRGQGPQSRPQCTERRAGCHSCPPHARPRETLRGSSSEMVAHGHWPAVLGVRLHFLSPSPDVKYLRGPS